MTGFILDFGELFIAYVIQYNPFFASIINAAICFVCSLPFVYGSYFLFNYIKERRDYSPFLLTLSISFLAWVSFFVLSAIIYMLNDSINILGLILRLSIMGYIFTIPFIFLSYLLLNLIKSRFNLPTFISLGPITYTCFFIFWMFEILLMSPGV